MAYTFTSTGISDEITDITVEDNFIIKVTFKVSGSFHVNRIMNASAFDSLREMHKGQIVLVATNCDKLMWVEPE